MSELLNMLQHQVKRQRNVFTTRLRENIFYEKCISEARIWVTVFDLYKKNVCLLL